MRLPIRCGDNAVCFVVYTILILLISWVVNNECPEVSDNEKMANLENRNICAVFTYEISVFGLSIIFFCIVYVVDELDQRLKPLNIFRRYIYK